MFSWDAAKAARNCAKHGVTFEEAATIFADFNALDWEDSSHSLGEPRSKRLGVSIDGRILLAVYTIRRSAMAKKRSASSAHAKRAAKSGKHIPDKPIDFSDIPESTDEELKRARRAGRPKTGEAKQLIAIRLHPRLLAQLRQIAAQQRKPYQTLIHELLESAAKVA